MTEFSGVPAYTSDVLPAQRRQVLQQGIVNGLAVAAQGIRGSLQIDRVPQHDSRRHQVEAAGPVALLLKAAVADFPRPVEEHGAGQRERVAGSAFVQHTAWRQRCSCSPGLAYFAIRILRQPLFQLSS